VNDELEILKLTCEKCGGSKSGTYEELFGDTPSLVRLLKIVCKCGGDVCLELTGEYR